jgi:hypothetical protein
MKPRLAYLKVLAIQIYMSMKIMASFRQTMAFIATSDLRSGHLW